MEHARGEDALNTSRRGLSKLVPSISVTLDLSALAVFRFLLGYLIIVDLINRSVDLTAHYTDDGLLPRFFFQFDFFRWERMSFHLWTGSFEGQALLFGVNALLAALLAFGWHTRVMTFLCWLFAVSLHNRMPILEHSPDTVLRLSLFWGVFLPLGARHSFDRLKGRKEWILQNPTVVTIASACYVIQIASLYLWSVGHKFGKTWFDHGTALHFALYSTQYTRELGYQFLALDKAFPGLLRAMTWMVLAIEAVAPIALFLRLRGFPILLRALGALALISLHLGIESMMDIGLFPWIDIMTLMPFLPWREIFVRLGWDTPDDIKAHSTLRAAPMVQSSEDSLVPVRRPAWWTHEHFAGALLVCLIAYVTLFNARFLWPKELAWSSRWASPAYLLRIDQYWYMFAPSPPKFGGWLVMDGKLSDGASVDPWNLRMGPPRLDPPALISASYGNERWRMYLTQINLNKRAHCRRYLVPYLCRRWGKAFPEGPPLASVKVQIMRQETVVTVLGHSQTEPRLTDVAEGPCYPTMARQ